MKATLLGDTPARYVSQMFYSDMNERKKEEGVNARPHAGTVYIIQYYTRALALTRDYR